MLTMTREKSALLRSSQRTATHRGGSAKYESMRIKRRKKETEIFWVFFFEKKKMIKKKNN